MSKSIKSFVVISSAFALILFQSTALWGGITGKISGRIIDEDTGEALAGANVMIAGTILGAAADAEGDYFVINIPPGTYEVTVSMIGYQTLTLTEVVVRIDLTTPVDFNLTSTVITGEAVTVTAEREIIKMDQSASAVHASISEIVTIPLVKDITEYIALQAGIEGDIIRGGGLDQTQFMLDGMMVVDNRANKPLMTVNLSSVKEISIIKGGFNAEYGNVRSGVINVITKSGDPDRYSGSVDIRYRPASLQHNGPSIMNEDNWYMRSYLKDDTQWLGTYLQLQGDDTTITYLGKDYSGKDMGKEWGDVNRDFVGWVSVSESSMKDNVDGVDVQNNDLTPEQARDLFIYRHAIEGSGAMGQKEKVYGNKPDQWIDASLSGPVPIIGRFLGNMSFFLSHNSNNELFAIPQQREFFQSHNTQLKVTSRLTPTMKLTLEGLYGEVHTINTGGSDGGFSSGRGALTDFGGGTSILTIYYLGLDMPMDKYRNMLGLSLEHTLSPRTFYSIKLSRVGVNTSAPDFVWRDRADEYTDGDPFVDANGNGLYDADETYSDQNSNGQYDAPNEQYDEGEVYVDLNSNGQFDPGTYTNPFGLPEGHKYAKMDESPWGYSYVEGCVVDDDNAYYTGLGGGHNMSTVTTLTAQFDITSQVTKYHQVKAGFLYVSDDLHTLYENRRYDLPSQNWRNEYEANPTRLGAYLQDKLEFEGMVANIGLRLDVNSPNTDWYMADTYSKYFKSRYKYDFRELVDTEPAEGKVKISPRIGISHPISETAKMYFNYGHFYSMPSSGSMYQIEYGNPQNSLSFLGNPNAELPKTIAYELGYEQNVAGILIHLSGYYKDVSDQTKDVGYVSFDGSIDYETIENNNYQDIRGFELNINKPFGRWFTGWFNYNYMVTSRGWLGRETYYEDPIDQATQGLEEPDQETPLARPILRCGANFFSPSEWGAILGDINVGLVYQWRAGRYETWDPLDTKELFDNVQWKAEGYLDLRAGKKVSVGNMSLNIWADVRNVLDLEYLNRSAFEDEEDRENYYKSLKLPMYKGDDYAGLGLEPGNDQLGDLKSDMDKSRSRTLNKDYIDMPNRDFLTFINPRYVTLGMTFNF